MDKNLLTPREISSIRNECDLYGFSIWLAKYLQLPIVPLSLRGYQHGWIWWEKSREEPFQLGLDPNLNDFWGMLVQDDAVQAALQRVNIFSIPAGLPFKTFRDYCGFSGSFSTRIAGSVLFVPDHSNPWVDVSESIYQSSLEVEKAFGKKVSLMLSWNDRHLVDRLSPYFVNIEVGAGALEISSFYRMSRIFESYEFVISNSMGSHILYASLCGARVALHKKLLEDYLYFQLEKNTDTPDYLRLIKLGGLEFQKLYWSADYLDSRFPGLITESSVISGIDCPPLASMDPAKIAEFLGWNVTLDSELSKRGVFRTK